VAQPLSRRAVQSAKGWALRSEQRVPFERFVLQ